MEHCFRIAIWMFLLLGFLQAMPVTVRSIDVWNIPATDLDFKFLKEVSCGENVKFLTLQNVTENCTEKDLWIIKNGLVHANVKTKCEDKNHRVGQILDRLEDNQGFFNIVISSNYTSNQGNWTQLADFAKYCEDFFQCLRMKHAL